MSCGYIGTLNSEVNASLRVDSTGLRCSLISDASFNIADDNSRKITFTIVVPKYVGFVEVDWASTLTSTETPDVDYVGWVNSNGVLNDAVNTTMTAGSSVASSLTSLAVVYGASDIQIAAVSGYSSALFQKFTITYYLVNNTGATISCQKLITGFSYDKTDIPRTIGTQFKIFASVTVGAEATTLAA
jgi:hypothetical protein